MSLVERMSGYRRKASWAVWKLDETGALADDPQFPIDSARENAHGRAMVVSLNPASALATEDVDETPDWSNFHSTRKKHNDLFLAAALVGTPLWGAYMTDLHPTIVESNSGRVRPMRENVESAVRSLVDQAKLLGEVGTIVCVGSKTYASVRRHEAMIQAELGDISIVRIPHYSRANAGGHKHDVSCYRALVLDGLGWIPA